MQAMPRWGMAAGRDEAQAAKRSRPTNADVARLAGVSTATVSYVLNNAEGHRISMRTRDAVARAAEQLGYRPNLAARNLARGKSGAILYVVPSVAVGEMPLLAGSRMTTELARRGLLQVQIFETDDDQHVVDAIHNIQPIAVTSLFPLSRAVVDVIEGASIPHIEIGTLPGLGAPELTIGELRVAYLASRGHRRIAFAYTGIRRWRALGDYWFHGVERAARERGLPAVEVGEVTLENAASVVLQWVDDGVTAVCAQSDEVACVVLYGIREAGLSCPKDLAVMGVDAAPIGALSSPPLTTVEFNPIAVADVAVAALLTELGHPDQTRVLFADISRLIVRAST